MADQPTVTDTTASPAGVPQSIVKDEKPVSNPTAAPEPNPLETTTAKDGDLPINNSVAIPVLPPDNGTEAVVPPPETPILVTESETIPTTSNTVGLAEEVESLSGEIQALEAKIDRLTGSVKPVFDSPKTETSPPTVQPPISSSSTQIKSSENEGKPAEPITISAPSPTLDTPPPAPIPSQPSQKTTSINDIYSKVSQRQKEAEAAEAPSTDEAEEVGSGAGIGTIGEVLTVFGVIIFIIMGAFPFYQSMLPESIIDAIRSIGWPTAVVSLALGFLLSLFNRGKILVKVFIFIVMLLAVVLYLGVAGFQNYLGPLGTMLESVFSFYR